MSRFDILNPKNNSGITTKTSSDLPKSESHFHPSKPQKNRANQYSAYSTTNKIEPKWFGNDIPTKDILNNNSDYVIDTSNNGFQR